MVLYFSGIVGLYTFFRKKIMMNFQTIILTYHQITDDRSAPDISVTVKNFSKQMAYLSTHFKNISLNELAENFQTDKLSRIAHDKVAITFDDGYRDNFLNAYPILKNHQLTATIFLISNLVNRSKAMLDIDEITTMQKDGIDFGSHTVTHKILSEITPDMAAKELLNSKIQLENLLNRKIHYLAYPKGKQQHYHQQIKSQVAQAGYSAAFTTENESINSERDIFELGRLGIRNCPMFVFKTRVSGLFESRSIAFIRKILKLT